MQLFYIFDMNSFKIPNAEIMVVGVSKSSTQTTDEVYDILEELRHNAIRGLKDQADKFQKR